MGNSIESMLYDFIVDNGLATDEEISLVRNICGWSEDTLNSIIWARSEYHDAEQCYKCESDTFYMSDELKEYYGLDEDDDEDNEDDE